MIGSFQGVPVCGSGVITNASVISLLRPLGIATGANTPILSYWVIVMETWNGEVAAVVLVESARFAY